MYYIVLFALFLFAASAEDEIHKCRKLFRPEIFHCCSNHDMRPLDMDATVNPEDLKKCWNVQMKPHSCEIDECIGKKMGYYKDGVIDLELLKEIIEKNTENDSEMQSLIKEKCLNANAKISNYGMPHMCDLVKMKVCFHTQNMKKCSQWSETEKCQEVKQLLEECSTVI